MQNGAEDKNTGTPNKRMRIAIGEKNGFYIHLKVILYIKSKSEALSPL